MPRLADNHRAGDFPQSGKKELPRVQACLGRLMLAPRRGSSRYRASRGHGRVPAQGNGRPGPRPPIRAARARRCAALGRPNFHQEGQRGTRLPFRCSRRSIRNGESTQLPSIDTLNSLKFVYRPNGRIVPSSAHMKRKPLAPGAVSVGGPVPWARVARTMTEYVVPHPSHAETSVHEAVTDVFDGLARNRAGT